jgi:hypothetical protein
MRSWWPTKPRLASVRVRILSDWEQLRVQDVSLGSLAVPLPCDVVAGGRGEGESGRLWNFTDRTGINPQKNSDTVFPGPEIPNE